MKKKLTNLFLRNWHWKILALVAACLFWYAYVNIQDPVATETLYNIPVKVLNYDGFHAKGNNIEFEDPTLRLESLTQNVTVRARTSVMKELSEKKDQILNVWIDLYELGAGDDKISIHYDIAPNYTYAFNNVHFVSLYNQSYYSVLVDENTTKTIPLEYSIVGSPAEDYIYIEQDPNMMLTPDKITLTGAQTDLDEVESARIMVSVEGLKANVALSESIMYYDKEGSRAYLSNSVQASADAATLYIPIYQVKTVKIRPTITGEASEGYEYQKDASLSTDSVVVYGQESDLKNIEYISLPEINIGNYIGTATEVFNIEEVLKALYPNDEVRYYSGSKTFRVSFTVAELVTKEIEIPTNQITITGKGNRVISFASDTLKFNVTGTASAIDAMDKDAIVVRMDLSDYGTGNQKVPVSITISSSQKVKVTDDEITATITIEEPEEESD